jgi:hypothetical protein
MVAEIAMKSIDYEMASSITAAVVLGLQQLADVVWLGLHTHELLPCQVIFQVALQSRNRVQLRTVGR